MATYKETLSFRAGEHTQLMTKSMIYYKSSTDSWKTKCSSLASHIYHSQGCDREKMGPCDLGGCIQVGALENFESSDSTGPTGHAKVL